MTASAEIYVMNGLLFLHDPTLENIPEIDRGRRCWSNADCVAFGCQVDCFAATRVTLGPSDEIEPAPVLVFDGVLSTPTRKIIVDTVMSEMVLEQAVRTAATRVRIWTLGNPDSEVVVIGLD